MMNHTELRDMSYARLCLDRNKFLKAVVQELLQLGQEAPFIDPRPPGRLFDFRRPEPAAAKPADRIVKYVACPDVRQRYAAKTPMKVADLKQFLERQPMDAELINPVEIRALTLSDINRVSNAYGKHKTIDIIIYRVLERETNGFSTIAEEAVYKPPQTAWKDMMLNQQNMARRALWEAISDGNPAIMDRLLKALSSDQEKSLDDLLTSPGAVREQTPQSRPQ